MHWSQTAQPANRADYKSERHGTENKCTGYLYQEHMNGPIDDNPVMNSELFHVAKFTVRK